MASCVRCCSGHEPTHSWSLRLLDGWRLCRHPADVVEVPTRERRLMSLLALRGERPRSQLAAVLWPDSTDSKAQANLRAAVWQLQHAHDGLLQEHHGFLRLSPLVRVDVHVLRSAADHLADGHRADATEPLLRMLCHEDLLPGWSEQWVDDERALLHQFRLRALEQLAEALLGAGDVEGALTAAMRAVAIDPLRESAHRALIRVHLAEGNHVEAMRVYECFRERLRDELGITVSAHLRRLVHPLKIRSEVWATTSSE